MANVIGTAIPHNHSGQRLNVYIGNRVIETATEPATVDRPGTLSVSVTISGRDRNFVFSVTDPDGIRALTSAVLTSSDNRTADVLGDFSRSDANTFAGTDARRNARWNSGSLGVVYVDATSGQSHTLLERFSV